MRGKNFDEQFVSIREGTNLLTIFLYVNQEEKRLLTFIIHTSLVIFVYEYLITPKLYSIISQGHSQVVLAERQR